MKYYLYAICSLILLLSTTALSQQMFNACADDDRSCMARNYEMACSVRATASIALCQSWLETLSGPAYEETRQVMLSIASTYYALSNLSEGTEAQQYRAASRDAYARVHEQYPQDSDALLGLALFTDTAQERAALLRQAAELAPGRVLTVRLYVNTLPWTREGAVEAASFLERLYDSADPPLHRGALLALKDAAAFYSRFGMEEEADRLRNKLDADIAPATQMNLLERAPDLSVAEIDAAIQSLCQPSAADMLGIHYCVDALIAGLHSLSVDPGDTVSDFVARSTALLEGVNLVAGSDASMSDERDWREEINTVIRTRFFDEDLETAALYAAYAFTTPADATDRSQRIIDGLEMAVTLDPDNGDYAANLARMYENDARWEDALVQLTRARELLPEYRRSDIDRRIRSVENNLE